MDNGVAQHRPDNKLCVSNSFDPVYPIPRRRDARLPADVSDGFLDSKESTRPAKSRSSSVPRERGKKTNSMRLFFEKRGTHGRRRTLAAHTKDKRELPFCPPPSLSSYSGARSSFFFFSWKWCRQQHRQESVGGSPYRRRESAGEEGIAPGPSTSLGPVRRNVTTFCRRMPVRRSRINADTRR